MSIAREAPHHIHLDAGHCMPWAGPGGCGVRVGGYGLMREAFSAGTIAAGARRFLRSAMTGGYGPCFRRWCCRKACSLAYLHVKGCKSSVRGDWDMVASTKTKQRKL
jgi:hypothetical protein